MVKGNSLLANFIKAWVLFAFSVLVIGLLRGESGLENYLSLAKSRDRLEKTIERLHRETESLEEDIYKIKHSKSYATKVLKDKYHVTEEGESIIFFAD